MNQTVPPYLHLQPMGRICLGEKLTDFQEMSQEALENPSKRIILDLDQVAYIDSSGLGEILKLFLECRDRAKTLVLARIPEPIMRVLRSAKLDAVFTITSDLEQAKTV